jgi:hypothetical protein
VHKARLVNPLILVDSLYYYNNRVSDRPCEKTLFNIFCRRERGTTPGGREREREDNSAPSEGCAREST